MPEPNYLRGGPICPQGHPFNKENTYIQPSTGHRFCLICKRAVDRRYRRANRTRLQNYLAVWNSRPENKRRVALAHERAYRKIRAVIDKAKQGPCADCGGYFPPCAMDFDHRDRSVKTCNVGQAKTIASALAEIEKCDLVCANCHRIRTWGREE